MRTNKIFENLFAGCLSWSVDKWEYLLITKKTLSLELFRWCHYRSHRISCVRKRIIIRSIFSRTNIDLTSNIFPKYRSMTGRLVECPLRSSLFTKEIIRSTTIKIVECQYFSLSSSDWMWNVFSSTIHCIASGGANDQHRLFFSYTLSSWIHLMFIILKTIARRFRTSFVVARLRTYLPSESFLVVFKAQNKKDDDDDEEENLRSIFFSNR